MHYSDWYAWMKSKCEQNRTLSIIWKKLMMSNNIGEPEITSEMKGHLPGITSNKENKANMFQSRISTGSTWEWHEWEKLQDQKNGSEFRFFLPQLWERKYKYASTTVITSWRLEICTKNTDTLVSGLAIKKGTPNNRRRSNTKGKWYFSLLSSKYYQIQVLVCLTYRFRKTRQEHLQVQQ